MNKKLTLILTVLFISAGFWQLRGTAIYSQNKPLTLGQVTTSLNVSRDKKKESAITARKVRQVGVTFPLTPEIEAELRASGATDELIEAIRENSPPVSTPKRTPVSTPTPTPVSTPTPSRTTTNSNESKTFKNSIGMEFVRIPGGSFMMGSPSTEAGRSEDEKQHRVTISKDFYLGKTEVTQGQWKAVMGNNPSYFKDCGEDCPVENVSWEDAQDFIRKLNNKGEGAYRLPTEAEWEYAARAGSTTKYSYGDGEGSLENYAWYNANSGGKTHPVATKQPNDWGLYDMHGNVWEWVQDWYGSYPSGTVTDPTGASSGSLRVARGGGWSSGAVYLRSAYRDNGTPSGRSVYLGFRVVRMTL